jgi:GWT1
LLTKANLPYVLWTVSYNTSFLLGYLVVYSLFFPDPNTYYDEAVPWTLEAINRNSLAIFLLVFSPCFDTDAGEYVDRNNKSFG